MKLSAHSAISGKKKLSYYSIPSHRDLDTDSGKWKVTFISPIPLGKTGESF